MNVLGSSTAAACLTLLLAGPSAATFVDATFFANSTRRDATDEEERSAVKVKGLGLCGGFFVKNDGDRLLIGSARHCAGYQFEQACRERRIAVFTGGAAMGYCKRVLIEAKDDDVVIFEAEFSGESEDALSGIQFLPLSSRLPSMNSPLKLTGYPTDPARSGRLTVAENCWVNDGPEAGSLLPRDEVVSLMVQDDEERRKVEAMGYDYDRYKSEYARINARARRMKYNCSAYGGDSGGPLQILGKPAVVGMPASYLYGVYDPFPASASEYFYPMSDFVEHYRSELQAAGIAVVDSDERINGILRSAPRSSP